MRSATTNIGRYLGLILVCAATGCTGWPQGSPKVWVEEERRFQESALDLDSVRVTTDNGSIRIRAAASETEVVEILATVKGGGVDEADARVCAKAIEVLVERSGAKLTMQARWTAPRLRNWGKSVSFNVSLPSRMALLLQTDNGQIGVEGVTGSCDLTTDNGQIKLSGGEGALRAASDNGGIEVETAASSFDLKTDNGSISARITAKGPIEGRVATDNGSVTLDLDEEASASVVARTDNGRISCSLPAKSLDMSKNSLRGQLGTGEGNIQIRTDNGSVTLK